MEANENSGAIREAFVKMRSETTKLIGEFNETVTMFLKNPKDSLSASAFYEKRE